MILPPYPVPRIPVEDMALKKTNCGYYSDYNNKN
jgi:hypothetical protein